jgi:hypothetical protein
MFDPMKVKEIVQLPHRRTIPQLQNVQGKANFLQYFVANYVKVTKGFMRLLKKGFPLYLDEVTEFSFESLKHALTSGPLLSPPYYGKELLLYLVATKSIINMLCFQEDDALKENVIYYLSQGLVGPELNYTDVEKFSLETFHAIQWFYHYILLCKTTVVDVVNLFQYVLTRWVISGKISRWIVIL